MSPFVMRAGGLAVGAVAFLWLAPAWLAFAFAVLLAVRWTQHLDRQAAGPLTDPGGGLEIAVPQTEPAWVNRKAA